MNRTHLILALIPLLWGCIPQVEGISQIRILNDTNISLHNLIIKFQEQEIFIPDLGPQQLSQYLPVDQALPHGYLKVEINGMDYELFPVANSQDTPLPIGQYTYHIQLIDDHSVRMDLMEY